MTTITRENAEIKSFITGFLSDSAHDNRSSNSLLANVFRIALASLEAEPVAYIFKHPAGKLFWALTDERNKEQSDVIPVYAAPPVPVVPEEKPMPNPLKMYAVDAVAAIAEVRGWNACRTAMLQGKSEQPQNAQQNIPENIPGGNYPVTPDGWISCSERMPDDGQHVIILCDGAFVLYAQYRDGEFFDIVRNGDEFFETQSRNVTDWMRLPEPPQEVNRG
ncbi:DUF551 domain-containing protein [Escherichia coli]|nr:DUF551 domain-containing protein [Escherichia coli]